MRLNGYSTSDLYQEWEEREGTLLLLGRVQYTRRSSYGSKENQRRAKRRVEHQILSTGIRRQLVSASHKMGSLLEQEVEVNVNG